MKVWITKYALTRGIGEVEASAIGRNGWIVVKGQGFDGDYLDEGRDWCKTREAAVACAEDMRTKKIAALERQLARLKTLEF